MGIIKKIFKPFTKETEQFVYQARALIKQDKISRGEKVLAPKHPTDEVHFKAAQEDETIREEINKRRDDLIQNVNKITVKSFDPPERPPSTRLFPSRETEQNNLCGSQFEYGYYEPPQDKMEPGKLTLREAMELLYAKTEIDLDGPGSDNAKNVLQTHPATSRISAEDIDHLYEYYRPFVTKDVQRVVNREDLKTISDYMNNRGEFAYELQMSTGESPAKYLKNVQQSVDLKYSTLDMEQKKEVIDAIFKRNFEENKRLEESLKELTDEFAEPKKKSGPSNQST